MRKLREKLADEKLSAVLDNLSAHKCKQSLETMQELQIEPIFCVPYSPDFNAIEGVIGQGKRMVKKERLQALTNDRQIDLAE